MIAHDRRGHGRSGQTWDGNEMDTYADDLAGLFEKLDLKDAIMVGHSTGGGEVARYLGRYGSKRVAKAALITGPSSIGTSLCRFTATTARAPRSQRAFASTGGCREWWEA